MRSIAVEKVDGTPRTVLNGKPVFMMATLDQGFWPDGLHTAPTDEALAYDLRDAQGDGLQRGAQAHQGGARPLVLLGGPARPAGLAGHARHDRRVNPTAAARAEYEREMKQMIDQHISSPSVVMWVTFNEGWGQYDEAARRRPGQGLGPDPAASTACPG